MVEVLIGIGIAAILIIAAAGVIAPALQGSKSVTQIQAKNQAANELLSNVKSWAAAGWTNVTNAATGSTHLYYLVTSASPFTATSGNETVTVGNFSFTRYFYLSDVYRDSSGNVTTTISGNKYDPSTKQITVGVNAASSTITTTTYTYYLTRNGNNVFSQTDWSGGSGQNNPVTVVGNTFASSLNVNSGVARTSLPNTIKSKSSGRASLRTFFGMRPNSFSSA